MRSNSIRTHRIGGNHSSSFVESDENSTMVKILANANIRIQLCIRLDMKESVLNYKKVNKSNNNKLN